MSSAALKVASPMFGDAVYTSTELNRRTAEVLNTALKRPVTVSRNNEQFALLRREQAAELFRGREEIAFVAALLSAIQTADREGQVTGTHSWVVEFDKDDRSRLSFEVVSLLHQITCGTAEWDDLESAIHEWKESALVAASGDLDEAMSAGGEGETPLPKPTARRGVSD